MVACLVCPRVGELRSVHCRVHVVVTHAAVLTTLMIQDHSHLEGRCGVVEGDNKVLRVLTAGASD